MNSLKNFLNSAANQHAREEALTHRVLSELKIAAAQCGYHLLTYYSDVDHDGFDIVFDDRTVVRKVQLKTVTSSTASWNIHKSLLRPSHNNWEEFGFSHLGPVSETKTGVEGGVILMDISVDDDTLAIRYLFTDIYVITAFALKLIPAHHTSVKAAQSVRNALSEASSGMVGIARGLFLPVASPMHLLAMMSLSSSYYKNWQSRALAVCSERLGPKGRVLPQALEEYEKEIPGVIEFASGTSLQKAKKKTKRTTKKKD